MFNILLPYVTPNDKVNDLEDANLLLKLPPRTANIINIATNSITITGTGARGAVSSCLSNVYV